MSRDKFIIIVFFDRPRTEYLTYGPFDTYELAEKAERKVWETFAEGSVRTVEISSLMRSGW
jgi:hypothetical protein